MTKGVHGRWAAVTQSKLRRGAVVAVDGVLAVGTGAVAGLFAAAPASPTAPTPGWTGLQAPLPAGPDAPGTNPTATMNQESCSSPVTCVDVGSYVDGSSTSHGLLETFSGGSWSALEAPLPSDAAPAGFSKALGASCAVDGSCVAVGEYAATAGGDAALVDTLSGGHWSAFEAPLPSDAATAGSSNAFLKSVDCTERERVRGGGLVPQHRRRRKWGSSTRSPPVSGAARWRLSRRAPPAAPSSCWKASRARPSAAARPEVSTRTRAAGSRATCSLRRRTARGRRRTRRCPPMRQPDRAR